MTHTMRSTLSFVALLAIVGCEKRMDDTVTPGDPAPDAGPPEAQAAQGQGVDGFRADLPDSSDVDVDEDAGVDDVDVDMDEPTGDEAAPQDDAEEASSYEAAEDEDFDDADVT